MRSGGRRILGEAVNGEGKIMDLQLSFKVIRDPHGFDEGLLLKGDWVFVCISDGSHTGLGEATHSGDDKACAGLINRLFEGHVSSIDVSLESISGLETGPFAHAPDFLTATAFSAINQALYDLLAKRDRVPVWRLFSGSAVRTRVPLYTTINRCLSSRDVDDYIEVVDMLGERGFSHFKCAPFDEVTPDCDFRECTRAGFEIVRILRGRFPDVGMRIDFHKRFTSGAFHTFVPRLASLSPYWFEEPFEPGESYLDLRYHCGARLAAGELYFGVAGFRPLVENGWVDVIMPDVKHVGGFGPLLKVCALAQQHGIEVSPHNPSGPVSTAASAHAAAVYDNVTSLEIPFDRDLSRARFGEPVSDGRFTLTDSPGWGIDLKVVSDYVTRKTRPAPFPASEAIVEMPEEAPPANEAPEAEPPRSPLPG